MRRHSATALALGLVLGCGWTVTARAQTTDEGDPKLTGWEWMADIRWTGDKKAAYYAVALPAGVLGKAQDNLGDLRLADDAGTRIPFAVRMLRPMVVRREQPARQFDAGPVEGKGYYEVSLELKEVGPLGHNEIEIVTPGTNFRRKVEVLGDNDAKFANARQVLDKDKYLVHYEVEGVVIDIRRLHYSPNKVRFLKVRVYADPSDAEKIPTIERVAVRYAEIVKGEDLTQPASLEERQPVRGDGGPGSAWFIDLGPDPVPCQRLTFTAEGPPADRPFRVEIADRDRAQQPVFARGWTWRNQEGRLLLDIDFHDEVRARRLKLVVTDFANPPLNLSSVQYSAAMRQLIFAAPESGKYREPLRLYFGNKLATPANYDFAQRLPATLTPPPQRVELGERVPNPNYQPPPAELAQQMPWLIYTMLGLTSLALLAILGVLARAAIRRHDAAGRATPVS